MLPSPVIFAPQLNHHPYAARDASPKRAPQPAQFQSLTNASFANSRAFMQIQMPRGCRPPDIVTQSRNRPSRRSSPPGHSMRTCVFVTRICYHAAEDRASLRRPVRSSAPPGTRVRCGLHSHPAQLRVRAVLAARAIKCPGSTCSPRNNGCGLYLEPAQ
jgi:hypothetical protein